jgi:hypothetical protein
MGNYAGNRSRPERKYVTLSHDELFLNSPNCQVRQPPVYNFCTQLVAN